MSLDSVSPDHQSIGEFSAHYLIQQGHRRILTLQCLRRNTMELRLLGIKDAFASNNMRFDDHQHLITTHGFGAEEAEQAITTFSQPVRMKAGCRRQFWSVATIWLLARLTR